MKNEYNRMNFKAAIELAAPHTWAASIMPVILGSVLSMALAGALSIWLFYSLLLTSVFLQCAVNTFNDYTDFVKGTDNEENSEDPNDASIVYNGIKPFHAFLLGVCFLFLAFLSGVYALITVGWELVIFGGVGAGIVILYSFGRLPIAYLPLGEIVSGFTMGGIIPLACYYAYTGCLNPWILLYSLPLIMTIGMIMFTNNSSDIERDAEAGRKTLPVFVGRATAKRLHLATTVTEVLLVLIIVYIFFGKAIAFAPLVFLLVSFPENRILKGGLVPGVRMNSMQGIIQVHWRLNLMYATMVVANMFL